MFYVLSKTIGLLVEPMAFLLLLGVIVLVAGWLGWRWLSRTSLVLLVLASLAIVFTPVGDLLIAPLEQRHPVSDYPPTVDGIILLGGSTNNGNGIGGYELNAAADRVVEAARLALRYPDARIVVTGGRGELVGTGLGDGDVVPALLEGLGIDPARVMHETVSRNTYENAIETRRLLEGVIAPGQTWLLVTSAFHMPRAAAIFEKAGFDLVPWPVDFRALSTRGFPDFFGTGDDIDKLASALKEYVGIAAYAAAGYLDLDDV